MHRFLAAMQNPLEGDLDVLSSRGPSAAAEHAAERPGRPEIKAQANENVAEIDAAEQVGGGKTRDARVAARIIFGPLLGIAQDGVGLGDLPEAVSRVPRLVAVGWYLRASWRNASLIIFSSASRATPSIS